MMPKNLTGILKELATEPLHTTDAIYKAVDQAHQAILALLPEAKEKIGDGSTYLRACGYNECREDAIKRMKGGSR